MEENFVKGVVLSNEVGTEYDDIIFTRWLELQCVNNFIINIFDQSKPISNNLIAGNTYELVLVASVLREVKFFEDSLPFSDFASNVWAGVIVEFPWKASENIFKQSRKGLFSGKWILVSTEIGYILLDPNNLTEQEQVNLKKGDCLQIIDTRWDLFAII